MAYVKPLPDVNDGDRPFWEAAKQHRLALPKCNSCGHIWLPGYEVCPRCMSADISWFDATGRGRIWGAVEMHRSYLAAFEDEIPYRVVCVKLDEGPLLFSNMVDDPPFDELIADARVEVAFDDVTDDVTLPKFKMVR